MENNKSNETIENKSRERSFSTTALVNGSASKNIVLGTPCDMVEISVRGQRVYLYQTNPIFESSKRLSEELKQKKEKNTYIYLDMCPNYFHIIVSYCKFLKDLEKYNNYTNKNIKQKFVTKNKNDGMFIYSMVYLEMIPSITNDYY